MQKSIPSAVLQPAWSHHRVPLSVWGSMSNAYNADVNSALQWYLLPLKPQQVRRKNNEIIKPTALHGQSKTPEVGFWSHPYLPCKLIRWIRNFKRSSLNTDEKPRWKLSSGEDLKADSMIFSCVSKAETKVGFYLIRPEETQKSSFF